MRLWFKRHWPDISIIMWIPGFFLGVFNLIPLWLCAIMILPAYYWLFVTRLRDTKSKKGDL